jgi:hypothetical protein
MLVFLNCSISLEDEKCVNKIDLTYYFLFANTAYF